MKNARQQKILEIIEKYDIDTQEALIVKLREEGFFATQTTVSRDINQLKLVKAVTGDGSYKYIIPSVRRENNVPVMNSVITDAVCSVEAAGNIVVVKTHSGMANAVAVCVDALNHNDIVGSVAGDDTILLVVRSVEIAVVMQSRLKEVFGV